MRNSRIIKISAVAVGVLVLVGASVFAFARPSGANAPPAAASHFSFMQRPGAGPSAATDAILGTLHRQDLNPSDVHVAASGLGSHGSRLAIFPGTAAQRICYGIFGTDASQSGMTYCYAPRGAETPDVNAAAHFNVSAEWEADNGGHTDVFGIAFDDVKAIRVEAQGTWRDAQLANNAFYLEVPATSPNDVTFVEATLRDGSVQRWDLQKDGLS